MARPEKHIPKTLEDAVAELKRDPSHPLRLAVSDVEVEMRLVGEAPMKASDDVLNGATWHGESATEPIQMDTKQVAAQRPGNVVGLFSDQPDLLDQVVEEAMVTRERDPLRRPGA